MPGYTSVSLAFREGEDKHGATAWGVSRPDATFVHVDNLFAER